MGHGIVVVGPEHLIICLTIPIIYRVKTEVSYGTDIMLKRALEAFHGQKRQEMLVHLCMLHMHRTNERICHEICASYMTSRDCIVFVTSTLNYRTVNNYVRRSNSYLTFFNCICNYIIRTKNNF